MRKRKLPPRDESIGKPLWSGELHATTTIRVLWIGKRWSWQRLLKLECPLYRATRIESKVGKPPKWEEIELIEGDYLSLTRHADNIEIVNENEITNENK
jgi:hypothetical protein